MKRLFDEYLCCDAIGEYICKKISQPWLFDSDFIRVKPLKRTSELSTFLQERQPGAFQSVARKNVAQFLGITPHGMGHFTKNSTDW